MTTAHNAKDILVEALDTIKATFWLAGAEFKWADPETVAQDYPNHFKEILISDTYGDIPAHQIAEEIDGKRKGNVVGVCSIGALALATATIYAEPLDYWTQMAQRDPHSMIAGVALARQAQIQQPFRISDCASTDSVASTITSWNDDEDRIGRDEVVDAFTQALLDPILAAEEIWVYRRYEDYSDRAQGSIPAWFATQGEAEAFWAELESYITRVHAQGYFTVAWSAEFDKIEEERGAVWRQYVKAATAYRDADLRLELLTSTKGAPVSA